MIESVPTSDHPNSDFAVFHTQFPKPLGQLNFPGTLTSIVEHENSKEPWISPLQTNDEVKKAIREMLRRDGFKPTGRSKPASEYLLKAISENKLSSINLAVDVLNGVSFHTGLPISVVDFDKIEGSLRIQPAVKNDSYVFNASGQEMDIGGLVCLVDESGPCANAVKDSQRTKTSPSTIRTLSVVWGSDQLPDRTRITVQWYRQLLSEFGAETKSVPLAH